MRIDHPRVVQFSIERVDQIIICDCLVAPFITIYRPSFNKREMLVKQSNHNAQDGMI